MNNRKGRVRSLGLKMKFNNETQVNCEVLLKQMVPPLPIPLSLPALVVVFSTGVHFTPW